MHFGQADSSVFKVEFSGVHVGTSGPAFFGRKINHKTCYLPNPTDSHRPHKNRLLALVTGRRTWKCRDGTSTIDRHTGLFQEAILVARLCL